MLLRCLIRLWLVYIMTQQGCQDPSEVDGTTQAVRRSNTDVTSVQRTPSHSVTMHLLQMQCARANSVFSRGVMPCQTLKLLFRVAARGGCDVDSHHGLD